MKNSSLDRFEEIRKKYENKNFISKRPNLHGVKRIIITHSMVIINNSDKETINFQYSWLKNKFEQAPISINIISFEDLDNNYEPFDSIQIKSIKKSIDDMQNEAMNTIND